MTSKQRVNSFHPWLIFLVGSSFLFYKFMVEVSPSVMANNLMAEFHVHGAELGNLASFYFYSYLIMQLPVGLLVDKYGPRLLTSIAILLCALGLYSLAHAQQFWVACAGRFLCGIGATFAVISSLKLIAVWFDANKAARMVGLLLTIGMLGAVFGQAPLAYAVKLFTWRGALTGLSMIGVILSIIYYSIIRNTRNTQQEHQQTRLDVIASLKKLLNKPQNWAISFYSALAFAPVAVLGGLWGVPFLMQAHHIEKTVAATDVSMVFIGFAIGAPLFGIWSDNMGKRKPLIYIGTLLAAIVVTIAIYIPSNNNLLLTLLLFLFGFFISSFLICFTMIREMNNLAYAATSVAFMNTLNAALCALSEPLIGRFLDVTWKGEMHAGSPVFSVTDYHYAFLAIPIYLLISLLIFTRVKETHCKQYKGDL